MLGRTQYAETWETQSSDVGEEGYKVVKEGKTKESEGYGREAPIGELCWRGQLLYVSAALAFQLLGVRPRHQQNMSTRQPVSESLSSHQISTSSAVPHHTPDPRPLALLRGHHCEWSETNLNWHCILMFAKSL